MVIDKHIYFTKEEYKSVVKVAVFFVGSSNGHLLWESSSF